MHRARFLRVGARMGGLVLSGLMIAGCHGGAGTSSGAPGASGSVDVKAACAALVQLRASVDALNGVDVADPQASVDALSRAVDAYTAALAAFERAAPASVRHQAAVVRAAVVARHFTQAEKARAPIDAWARRNCSS